MDLDINKIAIIFYAVVAVIFVIVFITGSKKIDKYMKKQKETGSDKNRMLRFMQQVMGGSYQDYTYAVAWDVKSENNAGEVTTYYLSYILAFNETEMQIISFVVNGGEILCRNVMPVDFATINMKYKVKKKSVELTFRIGNEKMPMTIDRVVISEGVPASSRPLGIYQEAEVDKLIDLLPKYLQ